MLNERLYKNRPAYEHQFVQVLLDCKVGNYIFNVVQSPTSWYQHEQLNNVLLDGLDKCDIILTISCVYVNPRGKLLKWGSPGVWMSLRVNLVFSGGSEFPPVSSWVFFRTRWLVPSWAGASGEAFKSNSQMNSLNPGLETCTLILLWQFPLWSSGKTLRILLDSR